MTRATTDRARVRAAMKRLETAEKLARKRAGDMGARMSHRPGALEEWIAFGEELLARDDGDDGDDGDNAVVSITDRFDAIYDRLVGIGISAPYLYVKGEWLNAGCPSDIEGAIRSAVRRFRNEDSAPKPAPKAWVTR